MRLVSVKVWMPITIRGCGGVGLGLLAGPAAGWFGQLMALSWCRWTWVFLCTQGLLGLVAYAGMLITRRFPHDQATA